MAIQNITVNIVNDLEIQESFTLKFSYPKQLPPELELTPEKCVAQCKASFRGHVVSVLNSQSKHSREASENRTFRVSLKTNELVGSQMVDWCCESVADLDTSTIVAPMLFSDMLLLRLQSLHMQ